MVIVNSEEHWKKALRNYTAPNDVGVCTNNRMSSCCCNKEKKEHVEAAIQKDDSDKGNTSAAITQFTTPMRRLIEKMPG